MVNTTPLTLVSKIRSNDPSVIDPNGYPLLRILVIQLTNPVDEAVPDAKPWGTSGRRGCARCGLAAYQVAAGLSDDDAGGDRSIRIWRRRGPSGGGRHTLRIASGMRLAVVLERAKAKG